MSQIEGELKRVLDEYAEREELSDSERALLEDSIRTRFPSWVHSIFKMDLGNQRHRQFLSG